MKDGTERFIGGILWGILTGLILLMLMIAIWGCESPKPDTTPPRVEIEVCYTFPAPVIRTWTEEK